MNKFYLYLFLTVILGATALGLAINTLKGSSSLFQDLLAKTQIIHDQALTRIKGDFNVPQDTWDKTLEVIKQARLNDDLFAPVQPIQASEKPWIVQRIFAIAQEYGMNPARITVKCVDAADVNLQAIQDFDENKKIIHSIEINLDWCNRHSKQMQEAFARHEMMHLYNYDGIEDGYITFMLDTLGHKPEDSAKHPSMINFRHAREMRADLLAGCNSKMAASCLCEHYTKNISLDSNRPIQAQILHPSAQDRADQLTQLMLQMNQQPTIA